MWDDLDHAINGVVQAFFLRHRANRNNTRCPRSPRRPKHHQVVLATMESHGRPKVREEARAIFEAQMEKDKAGGKLPRGPGLPAPGEPDHDENEPIFYFEALIVEGRKAE